MLLILPIIITTSREALESVPASFREVSLSLGASKWQTIRHIVLPNAVPGILTGTILGFGREIDRMAAAPQLVRDHVGANAVAPREKPRPAEGCQPVEDLEEARLPNGLVFGPG